MKAGRGNGGIAPLIRNLGARWRRVVNFTSRPLYLGQRALGTHRIRGWVGPRAGLDVSEKGTPVVQGVVTTPTALPRSRMCTCKVKYGHVCLLLVFVLTLTENEFGLLRLLNLLTSVLLRFLQFGVEAYS